MKACCTSSCKEGDCHGKVVLALELFSIMYNSVHGKILNPWLPVASDKMETNISCRSLKYSMGQPSQDTCCFPPHARAECPVSEVTFDPQNYIKE